MTNRSVFALLLAFFGYATCIAQNPNWVWTKQLGGFDSDEGRRIRLDPNGNVCIAGVFFSGDFDPGPGTFNMTTSARDIFVSKLDGNGNFIWAKQLTGTADKMVYAMDIDPLGNIYLSGIFQGTIDLDPGPGVFNATASPANYELFMCKLDGTGNFMWGAHWANSAVCHSLTVDGAGNVYGTGFFEGTMDFDPGAGTYPLTADWKDVFVMKLDPAGNLLWAKIIGGNGADKGLSLGLDGAGNIYIAGEFGLTADFDPGPGQFNLSSAGWTDAFVVQLDTGGNLVWGGRMGGTEVDLANDIAIGGEGDIHLLGGFGGTADFDPGPGSYNLTSPGYGRFFIAKLAPNKNLTWAKEFGSDAKAQANQLLLDGQGNPHIVGLFSATTDFAPGQGVYNMTTAGMAVFLMKANPAGDLVWAKQFGGATMDDYANGYGLALDPGGSIYSVGCWGGTVDFDPNSGTVNMASSLPGTYEIFVHKMNALGLGTTGEIAAPVRIFPNPNAGKFTVDLGRPCPMATLVLSDALGRILEVRKDLDCQSMKMDCALPAGVYFLRIETPEGEQTLRLAIE